MNETFTREVVMEGVGVGVEVVEVFKYCDCVWDVTPCILLKTYQCFGEYTTLRMESEGSFYKLWYCQTTQLHIPKDSRLN